MCRLIAYLGEEVLLENVLVKPVNSIVMQSLRARESKIPTNGDGFGVGWYAPDISSVPGLFTSISPAWNDRNLLSLTSKIMSPAFFAHVRAASAGGVSTYNCHPFLHGKWMLMHNGEIHDFIKVKRHLRHLLDDDIYHWIKGETDSEHFFALFLQLAKGRNLTDLSVVADIFTETVYEILQLVKQFTRGGACYFNVCLTDGKRLLASRYCSNKKITPESMHCSVGSGFVQEDRHFHMLPQTEGKKKCVLVASEKLTNFNSEWLEVPRDHLLLIDHEMTITLRPLAF